jgi:hypothetical protein
MQALSNISKKSTGTKSTIYVLSEDNSGKKDYQLKNREKVLAKVVHVPYNDCEIAIKGALTQSRTKKGMLIVSSDSNLTSMLACGLIGKHLNQKAFDIETEMRKSMVVDFSEMDSSVVWKAIVKRVKLSTSTKLIEDLCAVDENEDGEEEGEGEGVGEGVGEGRR